MAGVKDESREFGELFPAVYGHFCRRWGPTEYRPSPEACAILDHLAGTGPLTVTEAAAHFGRSQAATSELLDRLRERGLIERIRDERDQRRHLVWLTESGRALTEELRRVLDPNRLDTAFALLSAEERSGLLAGMRALVRAARESRHESKE